MKKAEEFLEALIPKTLVGLAVWVLMIGLGAALSGVALFAVYQRQSNGLQDRMLRLEEKVARIDARNKDLASSLEKLVEASHPKTSAPPPVQGVDTNHVAQLIASSIVQVNGFDNQGSPTIGSGFVVNTQGGDAWVVTSLWVVGGVAPGKPMQVLVSGAAAGADIRETDKDRDLALLIVHSPGLHSVVRAQTEVPVGSGVFAAGTSLGNGPPAIYPQHISAVEPLGLQTDQDEQSQLSGGPLLNGEGQVVGILSVRYAPPGKPASSRWAVPISSICEKILRCPRPPA